MKKKHQVRNYVIYIITGHMKSCLNPRFQTSYKEVHNSIVHHKYKTKLVSRFVPIIFNEDKLNPLLSKGIYFISQSRCAVSISGTDLSV